jgi:hypothetical protein
MHLLRIFSIALITALVPMASVAAAGAPADEEMVRRAFHFGFPVYEMMRVRSNSRVPANTLGMRSTLTGPQDRAVTAPNNDTLYASAWLDLSAGPVTLDMPALTDRYHSVHLMDLFTDAFAIPGTRTDGGRGGRVLIVGPEWKGQAADGVKVLRAPTNDVWMIVRVVVDGPEDLPTAVAAQREFRLSEAPVPRVYTTPTPLLPTPQEFLAAVNAALARGPVPTVHRERLSALAPAGIGPAALGWSELPEETRALWQRLLGPLREELRRTFAAAGTGKSGWVYPRAGLGRFGHDDRFRATVALGGLAALPEEEALYVNSTSDADGEPFDGSRTYRFVVPQDIPVDAFWSLTIYAPDGEGRWFLHENPIRRYSIGDRTKGIVRAADGSIPIVIQNEPPSDADSNWLPAPRGHFRLSFRAYLPQASFRDGSFRLPPVRAAPKSSEQPLGWAR